MTMIFNEVKKATPRLKSVVGDVHPKVVSAGGDDEDDVTPERCGP